MRLASGVYFVYGTRILSMASEKDMRPRSGLQREWTHTPTIEQPKSQTEHRCDILLYVLCSEHLEHGERRDQDDVAARLKVSRQPVKSAKSVLKANGRVEATRREGC